MPSRGPPEILWGPAYELTGALYCGGKNTQKVINLHQVTNYPLEYMGESFIAA